MHLDEDLLKYVTLRVSQFTDEVGEENFDRLASLDIKAFRIAMNTLSQGDVKFEEIYARGSKHVWHFNPATMKYHCAHCSRETSMYEMNLRINGGDNNGSA